MMIRRILESAGVIVRYKRSVFGLERSRICELSSFAVSRWLTTNNHNFEMKTLIGEIFEKHGVFLSSKTG